MKSVVLEMKHDMHLKDDDVFPIYDTIKEKLCSYFGKFEGSTFSVLFIDKTQETNTAFSYEVLHKLMTGWYIPVNSSILVLGRKRANYYEQAVEQYVNSNGIEYGKEFTVKIPGYSIGNKEIVKSKTETCIIYRNGKLYRNGEEDREFLFRYVLKV